MTQTCVVWDQWLQLPTGSMGDNGLPLPQIHPAITPKAYCPLGIFHFLETLMIKLQGTNTRRKNQQVRQLALGHTEQKLALF